MNDSLSNSINHGLTNSQDHRRFIYIGSLIGSLFLMLFTLIDTLVFELYINSIAEGVASIILLTIHSIEAKKPIQPWLAFVGVSTVVIVFMIGIFTNNAEDGISIWLAIMPFICFMFLGEKLGLITSIMFNALFIAALVYFCTMHPHKGFNFLGVITSAGALGCSTVLAWVYADNRTKLIALLSKQARTDTLTSLLNRRGLMSYFDLFIHLYKKNGQDLSVLIIDLDNFKRINDNFGHDIGDEFIISCANLIKAELGETDIAARLGGEEYIVLMPDTDLKKAENYAKKVKNAIENLTVNSADNSQVKVTASIGITCATKECSSFQVLYKAADEALYQAKHNGRNCIIVNA
ncbi:GGDEF domain-containing protein [Psychromonas algicola]|uniref:GGDEF domain-containing protein n=1 Tax=Psychromonas algicola TaxID=2555642 RepID=UPI001067813F|nr:GGDEF domain-containing protein [Psychromonas sp. RZ5]TEW46778.1 GGDEF domain-containing protein [Psychromonas sp. RZ5]